MNYVSRIFELIGENFRSDIISLGTVLSMLVVITLMSLYEFLVYRFVSKRTFYNKAFHLSVIIIPFFIGPIIMCLQTSAVVTLGTIGALAIIRFRTAIKDPVDMIYILWSVFIGITCGCKLYETCVITSLVVTIMMLLIDSLSHVIKAPYCIIIHTDTNKEEEISTLLKKHAKKYRVKSRNFTNKGVDYVVEINVKNIKELINELDNSKDINKFSVVEYDSEDIM